MRAPRSGSSGELAVVARVRALAMRRRCQLAGSSSRADQVVSAVLPARGRPRGRISRACLGSRPASASARRSTNSIWALVLRSSSAAHLAKASWTAGSSRSSTPLPSLPRSPSPALRSALPCPPSLVERAGVADLLGGLLAAQDDEQVRDHRGLALLVQLDDVLVLEPLQGQLHHADSTLHDPVPGTDDR